MEITRFIGKSVRGHFDFDISFRKGVNFLIGDNGSGKTTVLRLIKGMLMPSLEDLADIEYSSVCIELEDKGKKTDVFSEKTDNKGISIQVTSKDLEKPLKDTFPIEKIKRASGVYRRQNNGVISYISKILNARFIGTDRLSDIVDIDIDPDGRYIRTMSEFGPRLIIDRMSSNRMPFNSVDIALYEVRDRLYSIIRNNAKQQDNLINKFKNDLLSVLFKVFPISEDKEEYDFNNELKQLKNKRERLKKIFNTNSIGDDFSANLNAFFDQAEIYLNTLKESEKNSKEYNDAKNNWIANINPMRINEIINLADEYTNNMESLRRPIVSFINSANQFFNGSEKKSNEADNVATFENNNKKSVSVDGSGEIIIKFNDTDDKTISIFELSSGEKQLVILLGHLAFGKTELFGIDEPELSLHISWQEKFADALKIINPKCQYIMATHAPAIVAKHKDCCIILNR